MQNSMVKYIAGVAILAALYTAAAEFGLQMAIIQSEVSPIWPPSGIALAALLSLGLRFWPGVALGSLTVNLMLGEPVWVACCISAGNTLEALAGTYLLRKIPFFQKSLIRLIDVFGLIFLAAFLTTMIGATIGAFSLWVSGAVLAERFMNVWITWWLGDAIGILIMTPFLLSWISPKTIEELKDKKIIELVVFSIALVAAGLFIFSKDANFTYYIFPFLIWAAVSFGQRGSSLSVLILAFIAVMKTSHGTSSFSMGSVHESMVLLGSFMMIFSCTGMILSAALIERKQANEKVIIYKKAQDSMQVSKERLEALLTLSKMSEASKDEIMEFALEAVVRLTRSQGGYLHLVNEDEKTMDLVLWSKEVLMTCKADKIPHYPVDQAGVWADIVRTRKPMIHNDFKSLPDRKGFPEGHFDISRHMGIPVFHQDRIAAIAGVANKETPYDNLDIDQFTLFMGSMWIILEQKNSEETIKKISIEDALTGLANRRRFDEVFDNEWRRAMRGQYPLSLIIADIDFFKFYNDVYGHQQGDRTLRKVAASVGKYARRPGDLVARYGGEEFAAILPNTDYEGALIVAELMRERVEEQDVKHEGSKKYGCVTISAGISTLIPNGDYSQSDFFEKADMALYQAKSEGRNRVKGNSLGLA